VERWRREWRGGIVAVVGFQGECDELHQGEDDDFFSLLVEKGGGFFIEAVFQEGANIRFGMGRCRRRETLYTNFPNLPIAILKIL